MADETSNSLTPMRRALIPYESTEHRRHSDLSYRCIEGLTASDADLFQSLFGGAILRDCNFTAVNFARSDFNGTRIEGCTFTDCDLTSCDIRFVDFSRTTFVRCRLEGALIHHCSMTDVVFDECSFENGVIDGNVFERCAIRRCRVYRSSHINNKTFASYYEEIPFEQGSLMYWIARDCTFTGCSIGIESVGMVYGLSRADLERFAYFFPGEDEPRRLGDAVAEVVMQEYAVRGWAIGLAILKINLIFTSIAYAIKEYFDFLLRSDADLLHPPREELSFVVDVFDELSRDQKLPLLCCWDALRYFKVARRAAMSQSSQAAVRESSSVGLLVTRIEMLTASLLKALEKSITLLERSMSSAPMLLELTFEHAPQVHATQLIREATEAASLPCDLKPKLLQTKSGSHMEVLMICGSSLIALRLMLIATNGCLLELVRMRVNAALLLSPDLKIPKKKQRRTSTTAYLTRARAAVDGVVKFVSSLRWLSDPRLKGWGTDNLKRVAGTRLPNEESAPRNIKGRAQTKRRPKVR